MYSSEHLNAGRQRILGRNNVELGENPIKKDNNKNDTDESNYKSFKQILKIFALGDILCEKDKRLILIKMRTTSKFFKKISETLINKIWEKMFFLDRCEMFKNMSKIHWSRIKDDIESCYDINFEKYLKILRCSYEFKAYYRLPMAINQDSESSSDEYFSDLLQIDTLIIEGVNRNTVKIAFDIWKTSLSQPCNNTKCIRCEQPMHLFCENKIFICLNDKCIQKHYKNEWKMKLIADQYINPVFKNLLKLELSEDGPKCYRLAQLCEGDWSRHRLAQCFECIYKKQYCNIGSPIMELANPWDEDDDEEYENGYFHYECTCKYDEEVISYFNEKFNRKYLANLTNCTDEDLPFFWTLEEIEEYHKNFNTEMWTNEIIGKFASNHTFDTKKKKNKRKRN